MYIEPDCKGKSRPLLKGSKSISKYLKGEEVTKEEASKKLGVSINTVGQYMSKGKIKGDGKGGVDDKSIENYTGSIDTSKRNNLTKATKDNGFEGEDVEEEFLECDNITTYEKVEPEEASLRIEKIKHLQKEIEDLTILVMKTEESIELKNLELEKLKTPILVIW